jgi:dienelactone hydrolase
MQELPGVSPEMLRLADFLVDAGFQVVLPHLFGPLEKTSTAGNTVRLFCMRRQFHLFAARQSSPIVDWLRALCRQVKDESGAKGVGVIGMCLTGNFALSLMGDDSVLAAVAAQPSLPFLNGDALHMSPDEVEAAKQNIDRTAPMLAFRFEGDRISPARRFACIDAVFNSDGHERVRLTELPGNDHSVLTADFCDEAGHPTRKALDAVLDYFTTQLK